MENVGHLYEGEEPQERTRTPYQHGLLKTWCQVWVGCVPCEVNILEKNEKNLLIMVIKINKKRTREFRRFQ